MQKQNATQLSDIVRVEAKRSFHAHVDGRFGVINPGDVVDLSRDQAITVLGSQKAALSNREVKRDRNYEAPRLCNPAAQDPNTAQVAALTAAVQSLQAAVEGLPAAIQQQLQLSSGKKG